MNEQNIQTVTMEEIWKQNTDGHIPVLLEIYNPDIRWGDNSLEQDNMYLRLIDDTNPITYKGKKYLPCKFSYTPPEENGQNIGNATLTLSAIDTRVTQLLRSIEIESRITVVAAFVKEGNIYTFLPFMNQTGQMVTANYNRVTASITVVNKDVLQLNVPRLAATKDLFPSVVEEQ